MSATRLSVRDARAQLVAQAVAEDPALRSVEDVLASERFRSWRRDLLGQAIGDAVDLELLAEGPWGELVAVARQAAA